MKKIFIFLAISTAFIQGCKQESPLDQKKKELTDKKKEFAALKDQIGTLEKEVAKLEGKTEQKGKPVLVENVTSKDFSHYIEVQGKVESDQDLNVSPEAPGTITKVLVSEGQSVKQGQLLAEIDASTLLSQLNGAKTQLEFAKTMYEKQKRLRAQNVGTETGLLQAKAQYEGAESQVTTLQRQLKFTRITSPISGVVDAKMINVGSVVAPGMPAFKVVGGSDYKVVGQLSESYLTRVKRGLEVLVFFPDLNQEIKGVISNISQSIDPSSRTFSVEVKIKATENIRPNLIAIVKVRDYSNAKTIAVPVNAIQHDEEGNFVFLAKKKDDHYVASRRIVTRGATYRGKTEIVDGLKAGDLIVITGYQDLVDDQPIKIKNQ